MPDGQTNDVEASCHWTASLVTPPAALFSPSVYRCCCSVARVLKAGDGQLPDPIAIDLLQLPSLAAIPGKLGWHKLLQSSVRCCGCMCHTFPGNVAAPRTCFLQGPGDSASPETATQSSRRAFRESCRAQESASQAGDIAGGQCLPNAAGVMCMLHQPSIGKHQVKCY
jgi:hypothetical protein